MSEMLRGRWVWYIITHSFEMYDVCIHGFISIHACCLRCATVLPALIVVRPKGGFRTASLTDEQS
jgi:hypothetical protein